MTSVGSLVRNPHEAPHHRAGKRRYWGLAAGLLLAPGASGTAAWAELRDPTRPAGYGVSAALETVAPEQQWWLTLIKIDGNRRSAVVNGRLVRKGDVVDGATVVEIRPSRVVLSWRGQRIDADFGLTQDGAAPNGVHSVVRKVEVSR